MKLAALITLVLSAPPAAAPVNDEAPKFEDQAIKLRLKVVTDGKGHYLAVDPHTTYHGPFFYGDAKVLYKLRSSGGGASGKERFSVSLWDPRVDWKVNGNATFEFKDGKFSVSCPPKVTELAPVPEEEGKKLLEAAELRQPRWQRMPHKLARDDKGTYYFVDCARDDNARAPGCSRDWRLYVGPRGKLKPQQMTNVVHDSEGEIFATRSGELRLVLTEKDKALKWVSGKTVSPLINVPVEDNGRMIYTDLGVYDRERLGTPCDDM